MLLCVREPKGREIRNSTALAWKHTCWRMDQVGVQGQRQHPQRGLWELVGFGGWMYKSGRLAEIQL